MDPNYQQNQQPQQDQQFSQPQQPQQMPAGSVKTNTLAIVGFILSFFMPLVGIVLCLVAISQIKKTQEGGKGLARAGVIISTLFIVIPIIFLFIILVFTSSSNTQGRARDFERKADIRLIESKLAEYRKDNSSYPDSLEDVQDIPVEALQGPKSGEIYNYTATPEGCSTEELNCTSYSLSSDQMETEDNPYLKNSLY